MNENVKKICDLIVSNRNVLRKKMFWEIDTNTYAVMGGILTAAKGVEADADDYKSCKKIIRKNISMFSEMRGFAEAIIAIKMTMVEDKEAYVKGVEGVYKKLRSIHKLTASPYMVMAAMNIYESKGIEGADEEIEKLEKFYKSLKEKHPFLISDSDRGYLSMLVVNNINIEDAVDAIENNYEACKKISVMKNSVYSLAQVLALSKKTTEANLEFVETMIKGLKKASKPISKEYGLTAVGALSLVNKSPDELVADITETYDYLKTQKGFKWYYMGRRLRTTYAAIAVFLTYSQQSGLSDAISSNITVAIAEEILMLLVIMMVCSNTSSRSASSGASAS